MNRWAPALLLLLSLFAPAGAAGEQPGFPAARVNYWALNIVPDGCTVYTNPCPARATGGVEFGFTVVYWDTYGPGAQFWGTVHFDSSDPKARLPADYTFRPAYDGGEHHFTAVFETNGAHMLNVTCVGGGVPGGFLHVLVSGVVAAKWSVPAIPGRDVGGIAAGPGNTVWYTFTGSNGVGGVAKMEADGRSADLVTGLAAPGRIAVAPDGIVWYAAANDEARRGPVLRGLTPSGALVRFEVYSMVSDIAVASDGSVWFVIEALDVVYRIPLGSYSAMSQVPFFGSTYPFTRRPYRLAATSNGFVWITERSGAVAFVSAGGGFIQEYSAPGLAEATEIAADSDGSVWFFQPSAGQITQATSRGVQRSFSLAPYRSITGIAFASDGSLWASTNRASIVQILLPAGPLLNPIFREYSTPGYPAPFSIVQSGGAGRLWLGSPGLASLDLTSSECAALCLDGRFDASIVWKTTASEAPSAGRPVPLTVNAGYFWFFSPENVELLVKLVDGRAENGHYWFFAGSLTDVEFTLTIRDTVTGAERTYANRQGTLASIADVAAF